jgi:hypothetical protein
VPPTEDDLRVTRIASLTLVNAMIFQQVLADRDERVEPLARTVAGPNVAESFAEAWNLILTEIDYVPIFRVAREIIVELTGSPGFDQALRQLATSATRITARRAALRHDLMGRIYHRLLAEAKYFGAFYTTVPAAALLLKLTLDPNYFEVDWSDVEQIRQLRVADLACGTGTLLKASLQTVIDNHVRSCAENQETPDLQSVHQALVEEVLWGLDVIPFAIHLAASALAIHEPDVPFNEMSLYTLPIGGVPPKLGSLELLANRRAYVQADLFGGITGPGRVTGTGDVIEVLDIPPLDLCVMNPPFTRSVGKNLLFGHAPEDQRKRMQKELRELVKREHVFANITAGLGSVFSALGHKLVKPGGHLSLVLPRALLSGVAWGQTRQLIGANYYVRYIMVSHEPGNWNFSENTKLSECMIVAKRLREGEAPSPTKVVNLWVKPKSSIEAMAFTKVIIEKDGVALEAARGSEELSVGDNRFGELILCPPERIRTGEWYYEVAFSQTDLNRSTFYLTKMQVYIPGRGILGEIPLISLRELSEIGPDRRDIHDGFRVASRATAYPVFWGHDTSEVRQIAQTSNGYLAARTKALANRKLRDAELLWSRSGRLLIAERLRLNTARVVSVHLEDAVLSNTWWPVAIIDHERVRTEDIERILALWFNSTLGIMSLIAARVDTEGAWVDLKKPTLESLAVLNPTALSARQIRRLVKAYEELSQSELSQLPQLEQDGVRSRIDSVLMDTLGIEDDLSILRRLVSLEPLFPRGRE